MARRFAKVSEEEIEEAFFYPSDLVNTKTTIPLRVGEERWIYTSTLRVSVYIHHYSPPLRGIVVYYYYFLMNQIYPVRNSSEFLRSSTAISYFLLFFPYLNSHEVPGALGHGQ